MGSLEEEGSRPPRALGSDVEPVRADLGIPGQWLLSRPWSDEGGMDPCAWMASSLRMLKSLSAVFGLCGAPGEPVSWVEVVPGSVSPLCLGTTSWPLGAGPAPGVKVPESFLLSTPRAQEETLRRLLAAEDGRSDKEDREKTGLRLSSRGRGRESRVLVEFVNPASLSEPREREFTGIPPAAFFMAPALLRKGFQVEVDTLVLDPFAEPDLCPENIRREVWTALEEILNRRPLCIAVTAMDLYADSLRAFLREVRARDPEVLLAVGGPMVTLYGARAVVHLPEANIFLRGDGDLSFARVLSALARQGAGQDLGDRSVRLLSVEDGLLVRCGATLFASRFDRTNHVEDLDSVFRDKINLGYIKKRHLRSGLSLHTLRGCPYRCAFCTKVHGSRVRKLGLRTLRRILEALQKRIEEIDGAEGLTETERRHAYRLRITDDDFLLDRNRARLFFREAARFPYVLKTVPAGIPSFLEPGRGRKGRFFDRGLAACLEDCRDRIGSFEIGTDDFSQAELDRLTKAQPAGYGPEEIREVVSALETLGIRNRHFVLLSNPGTRWPDLFEKIVTLEQWSWEYHRFLVDPNPFVLAPAGTALFENLAARGRLDSTLKRVFSVEGYPEFTHWAVNVALPDERLFSSPLVAGRAFFQRLADLLRGPQRFSAFNDVYLQYLLWRRHGDSAAEDPEERGAVLCQVRRAVRHRREKISRWHQGRPFPAVRPEETCRQKNRMVAILWGLCLVRRTWKELFAETGGEPQENEFGEDPCWWESPVRSSEAGEPEAIRDGIARLRQALRLVESCMERLEIGFGLGTGACDFARSFRLAVRRGLEERALWAEAARWESACAQSMRMVRLEVNADRKDAWIVEDSESIERTAALIELAKPGFAGPVAFLPFLRALRVLERSIREDFLETSSETRRFLYGRLEDLPAEFQARFGREFGVCPFTDRDAFLAALLARYLGARTIPHDRQAMGTWIFRGIEPILDSLVPAGIKRFVDWLLDSTCRTSGTRSGRNRSDP